MSINVKKAVLVIAAVLATGTAAFAQQNITNFGVVNTDKIYERYFAKSGAVKAYEAKRKEVQKEITKRTAELRDLKEKKDACKKVDDEEGVKLYDAEIKSKAEYLRDYTSAKNLELKNMKDSLAASNEFYSKLRRTIRRVAENEGLSMVVSLSDDAIVWYSVTVDITDKVIRELDK
ncbi:MAG: OmpH family outer membrane protein [Treponema sp.]|nr:OmpH family outer membrane protein [Treponema sp.]